MAKDALPISEVFPTIQGEGFHTGTPAVFIRLQGCNVGCPWCDTRHSWPEDAPEISIGDMLTTEPDQPRRAMMTVEQIMALLDEMLPRHVVLTGGEPCMHDLHELTAAILASGRSVQIETSGTSPVNAAAGSWITCSPKYAMPGGLHVLDSVLICASELKFPVGKMADVMLVHDTLRRLGRSEGWCRERVFLQPLSESRKATELCVANCIANGWRLSLQVHKTAGLR